MKETWKERSDGVEGVVGGRTGRARREDPTAQRFEVPSQLCLVRVFHDTPLQKSKNSSTPIVSTTMFCLLRRRILAPIHARTFTSTYVDGLTGAIGNTPLVRTSI